eukprot:747862-Hanusia_phi.AAC.11
MFGPMYFLSPVNSSVFARAVHSHETYLYISSVLTPELVLYLAPVMAPPPPSSAPRKILSSPVHSQRLPTSQGDANPSA